MDEIRNTGRDTQASTLGSLLSEALVYTGQAEALLRATDLESITQSQLRLESAVACCQAVQRHVRDQRPAATDAVRSWAKLLQQRIRRIAGLIETASRFRLGWAQRLAGMTAGYTSEGTPAPLGAEGRLLIEG
jgi:hypothetical protein